MADTEEEKLARRLEDMKLQLDHESGSRDEILRSIGGFRSMQVRMDCLNRCRTALHEARSRSAEALPSSDRLTALKHERRIRLLEAAVSRCESEFSSDSVFHAVSDRPDSPRQEEDPYTGTFFLPETCHILEKMITAESSEPVSRIPALFTESAEADSRTRWKFIQAFCRNETAASPFELIVSQAYRICSDEISSSRFLSRGEMPDLPLLPDLLPSAPLIRICDVLSILPPAPEDSDSPSELRGLLSMLLLRNYRRMSPEEAALRSECCTPGASPVLRYWLEANRADKVYILSLSGKTDSAPFALVLPEKVFIPARRTGVHTGLVPAFTTWYDAKRNSFADPCAILGEGDRKLLVKCLDSYISSMSCNDCVSPLLNLLSAFREDLSSENKPYPEDPSLMTRIRAVCGLPSLSAYASSITVTTCYYEHFLPEDMIGICLTDIPDYPAFSCSDIPEEKLYQYRGVPFAREDSTLLLAGSCVPGEEYTLKRLETECSVLSDYSDDYRDALLKNIPDLLERYPDVLPEVRESAEKLITDASDPVGKKEPVFEWPWDTCSPSILTVLRECIGDSLPASGMRPFSERLAVFPARGHDVIGDAMLSSMCSIPPFEGYGETADIAPDAVLPPLSPEFGYDLCRIPEGRTLIRSGLLRFERNMNDTIRVTLTLDGSFPVRLVRVYSPDEILHLYSHDIPTVAVWPSVPFAAEDWKTYFVYAHMPESCSASVLQDSGKVMELEQTSEGRYTAVSGTFPVCVSVFRDGTSIGILPNILPQPDIAPSGPVDICLDFGSSGTSVVFASEHQRKPLHGPVMVRTLLNNPVSSQDLLRREFLPAVPVSALFPTVSRLFRNVPGTDPVPFADGIVLMSSDLEDLLSTPSDAIYTSLRWEEEKGRSGFLCLHQIMLMAALQARCDGAQSVSWRFSLPDEMAKEGRESLMNLFLSISENVLLESGYHVPGQVLPVSFASDSSALGAYFRFCAPDDTRGGFMVLDLGACTADISLFLRGREQAVRTCQIPLGIQYMLLPALLKDPELLMREFSFCNDPSLRRDLSLLSKALAAARTDPVALRRARVSLDYLIADYLPLLISCMIHLASSGTPTKTGAISLFYLSYLLMLSGLVLLQIAADPNRNDFLPEQMSLCLAGRGSSLIEALPAALKSSLWHFLSMFRNRRIASISFLFSAEKKMEIPVGLSVLQELYHMLPPSSAVPASVSVRPAELLPEFLLRFRKEFPASANLLFPGFFGNDYYHPFTDLGESLVSSSVDHSFPRTDNPRPYDSLAAWPGNLFDLLS